MHKHNKHEKQRKELTEFNNKIEELTDSLQQLQAEFENYKKRVEKEKKDFIRYASHGLIIKLIPIVDSFESAPYCQISPSMTVVTGVSNTQFTVSSADAAKFSAGQEIAMHYPNMVVQSAAVTITDITGTTITVDTLGATPSAGWIAQYAVYDSCTTAQKYYWFASDGSDELGAANDPAHLITA